MKLKIKVTKEILRKSAMCGEACELEMIQSELQSNCSIALACQKIFPNCAVKRHSIASSYKNSHWSILLPEIATAFIDHFDNTTPFKRLLMPELEFEVELNEDVLAAINIEEAREALKNSTTLELIEG
jgi:hypothetical protein